MRYKITNENINKSFIEKLARVKKENIINRIWKKDYTIWSKSPNEISNRLGWLDSIESTNNSLDEISRFVNDVRTDGFNNVILMGMGGSSLAPEVFRLIFGVTDGFLDLKVVDSTHPDFIIETSNNIDIERTLFIVSTKSGGTIETISFMKFFFNRTINKVGKEKAGSHFVAITDPGSGLEKIALDLKFRKIFLNDPNIGGRYSALSLFGMVPAALIGVDLDSTLRRAKSFAEKIKKSSVNSSAELGLIMGVFAAAGLDKLTFITSQKLKPFGAWIEQLIAESTGKSSKGILPVDLEEVISAEEYSKDRLFVYIKLKNEYSYHEKSEELKNSGFNVITIELDDIYDLGAEFFRWEFATIISGWLLGIQPFDQPNVESAKVVAREMIADYKEKGKLSIPNPTFTENNIKVFSELKSKNLKDCLEELLNKIEKDKSYVAIQAYVKPGREANDLLYRFRTKIQKKYKVATTLGYGPRFLHSTGQLHKGDGGTGLFIQIIDEPVNDIPIPDVPGEDESSVSFGVLIKAQVLGDRKALLNNKREVITFDLGRIVKEGLETLVQSINS